MLYIFFDNFLIFSMLNEIRLFFRGLLISIVSLPILKHNRFIEILATLYPDVYLFWCPCYNLNVIVLNKKKGRYCYGETRGD